jgi:hypothetical protein
MHAVGPAFDFVLNEFVIGDGKIYIYSQQIELSKATKHIYTCLRWTLGQNQGDKEHQELFRLIIADI